MIVRLALRELVRSWRFGLFFIFNLTLGLSGFVSLQAYNFALKKELDLNAKSILSADLSVSARRELTESEIQSMWSQVPLGSEVSQLYEFFAMMNFDGGSRLVLVKAIDESYPFYGALDLESGQKIISVSKKDIIAYNHAWIYPELRAQLGLSVGKTIQIGKLKLEISDVVAKDQTQTFRAASVAPRVFISRYLLKQSGLIQFGSTFTTAHLFKLPSSTNSESIKQKLYQNLPDPQISVDTPQSASEDSGRQLNYLSDYLGLVSLVALFLSTLGAAYLYRLFLSSRLKEIAILRTLGLQSGQAVAVYLLQVTLLGCLTVVPVIAFSQALLPLMNHLLGQVTPIEINPGISAEAIFVALLMAVVGCLLISLPFLIKILELKAAKLFIEDRYSSEDAQFKIWAYIPAVFLFFLMSIFESHSLKVGSLFFGTMIVMIIILALLGWSSLKFARHLSKMSLWYFRFSYLGLSRRVGANLALFIALGMGALLINILPQLKNSIQNEIQLEGSSKVPSLFLFDIQDDQLIGVNDLIKQHGVEPLPAAPLVRARILKVNGVDYERKLETEVFKTREEEQNARFRNRGVNLSYRLTLSSSEKIVEGVAFSGRFDSSKQKLAEISVEQKYAQRMGFKIGDELVFDVQGVTIEAKIINFRRVKWTSFQPNFFILFQEGVFEDAPKTFIEAIPSIGAQKRAELQNEIARKFSNISAIDVVRLVEDILKMSDEMSWSLELMAVLALFTGYVVLFSIVRGQIKLRRWELNLLKVLGSSFSKTTGYILNEFIYLAFFSALVGAGFSVLVSYILNAVLFEAEFKLSLGQPLKSVAVITALSLLISFLATLDILKESPLKILREED